MDGVAVDSESLRRGVRRFRIQATQAAGAPPLKLERGEAIEVMTGAILPQSSDCVIALEQYDIIDGFAVLKSAAAAAPYHNVHESPQGASWSQR